MSAGANASLTDEFRTTEVVIRGKTYKFKEISAADYEDILKLATGSDDTADLGAVLKMMTIKCCLDPVLTADDLRAKPYPVYAKLLATVNRLHFSNDEEAEPSPNS